METRIRIALFTLALLFGAGTAVGTAAADTGTWKLAPTPGGYEAAWTSPEPLPVTSDRPEILLDGESLGPATVSPDGRELSIFVPGDGPPAIDRLDVRLSGRTLDEPPAAAPPPAGPAWIAPAGSVDDLGFDPGQNGTEPIRVSNYTARSFSYPGLRRKLETAGHVVAPSDATVAATAPLVLFLHGRHSTCYDPGKRRPEADNWPCRPGTRPVPSYLGYDYLQRNLASQGFVTVSIAANGINAQDDVLSDGGARARAALIRRHLDLWAGWVASGRHRADLGRVILVGHSRGGEGANRASGEIPATAPYRIAGQILLAPTNFARQTAAYIPTVTVLPYCDGDVSNLQGEAYTDASVGLATADSSLKSSVTMFGANHNFFNSEWTPGVSRAPSEDDSSAPPRSLCGKRGKTRLTGGEQRRVARSYVAGAVQLMTGTDEPSLALFDGSAVRVGPVSKATVSSQSVGGGKRTLTPGRGVRLAGGSRPAVRICRGYSGGESNRACAPLIDPESTPHWPGTTPPRPPSRPALEMRWEASGRTARLELAEDLDLTGRAGLDLRVVVDPEARTARLGVAVVDADGAVTTLDPDQNGRVDAMPADRGETQHTVGRYLARTLRVPLPPSGSSPADLGRIRSIRLTGGAKPACGRGCPTGSRVWILDLSVRTDDPLPPSSAERLPLIRLKHLTRTEGDATHQVVRVPFTVTGQITDPNTRLRVVVQGGLGYRPAPKPYTLRLATGQRSGSIPIKYRGNRVADLRRRITVTAFPQRGITPWTGSVAVRLRDDDPRPRLKVKALQPSIRAGQTARWEVSLTRPIGWHATIAPEFVATPGLPPMRLRDLPGRWAGKHLFLDGTLPDSTRLSDRSLWFVTSPGLKRRRVIAIPTVHRMDGKVRGLRLRLNVAGFPARLTPIVRVEPG